MLDSLRKSLSGIVAKILISILAISFLFWGVEDVFRGFRQGDLAKVGTITVTNTAFENALRREIDQFSRQVGQRLTQEQARMFGLDQRALDQLVGGATIDNHAASLNLAIPTEKVAEDVRSAPAFQGVGNSFDRDAFSAFLRQVGLSERAYAETHRREMLRAHITSALLVGLRPPEATVDLIHLYTGEQRVVEHFEIDPKLLPKLAEPTDADLRSIYADRKQAFVRPEYRKLRILVATADALKDRIKVSDDDVRKSYEATRGQYEQAERRTVQQIPFKTLDEAKKARAEVSAGKSFLDVAKATGASESDINLGTVEKSEMLDRKIADAVFALKVDEVSQPIEGKFSTVLINVTQVVPGISRTFDDVKDVIRTSLQRDRARVEAQKAHDLVDDQRLSGRSLNEVAEVAKLRLIEVAAVDRQGLGPDGKPAIDLPDAAAIVAAAFQSDVGVENESLQSGDGGYLWFDVAEISPEQQKTFDDVKTEAGDLWRRTENDKALTKLAADFVRKANAGTPMASLAVEAGGTVKTSDPVRRGEQGGGITRGTISRAFAIAKGAAASVPSDDSKTRIVFKVAEIIPPKAPNQIERKGLVDQLTERLRTDAVASYVAALQERYKPDVNRQALDRLTGRTTATQ